MFSEHAHLVKSFATHIYTPLYTALKLHPMVLLCTAALCSQPHNKITLDSKGEEVFITGIDKHGYLVVQEESGGCMQLQPDGNSFDLMRSLIKTKTLS